MATRDEPLEQLERLLEALTDNTRTIERIRERATALKAKRAEGLEWAEIVATEERPLIVESLSENIARLTEAGSRFRRAEARALHAGGMTMERIADLFGVSRQRVSALLREDRRA